MLAATPFWDVFWFIVISFLFLSYLILFFQVVGDLFRDREVSGAMKVIWIVALIVFPFLSLLIYLLTRGKGMAERQAQQAQDAQKAFDAYVKQAAGTGGAASELASAKSMLDSGAISAEEYEKLKAKIIG
jgi:Na+-transporting methylmalonyl-CoA/oxaloacetate decarboxylase gamma subunit